MNSLPLKKASDDGVGSGSGSKVPQSTSSVVESDICDRDDDKERIFEWLTSDTDKKLSILSIVSMGGLGKTTLAQLVYNDSRIDGTFDIKASVCVSEKFDVFNVSRSILDTIIDSTDHSRELEMVQRRLKENLADKRFLLTTRSEKLLSKHAFQDGNPQPNPECEAIVMKIVEKCKALPLALKTMGSLLHNKSSVSEWENILKSEIWELEDSDIVSALALSYPHLPPTCFAYCGLFGKDYEFDKECLIQLWMAENFLHCHKSSKSPEEVEQQYFHDLLSRSLFQQSSKNKEVFVMHDLLNDLAKYVCGDIYFSMSKIHDLFSKFKLLRVLSLSQCSDIEELPDSLSNRKHLRSFELSNTCIEKLPEPTRSLYNLQILKLVNCTHLKELPSTLHKLVNLRVLSLSHCFGLTEVPNSVDDLKQLLSLDLSQTRIKKLPDSTCLISNLQILKLNKLSIFGGAALEFA
uniref:NB-ARC domain-containing protein n=1 Tax=Glycine max TaxID=3847 RepID=A0A0R0GQQ5_SOYBN